MKAKTYTIEDIDNPKFDGGEKYSSHKIFGLLIELRKFYDFLQINSNGSAKAAFCVKDMHNIDAVMFGAIKGTVTSIKTLLEIGSINDAFALVRKYEDAMITNIYVDLLLDEEHWKIIDELKSEEEFVFSKLYDNKINEWVYNKNKLGGKNGRTEKGISEFEKVKELSTIFNLNTNKDSNETSELAKFTLRQLCNNNVHYNAFQYFLYNNADFYSLRDIRVKLLDKIYLSIKNIFVVHFSYMLVINPEYYRSTDYTDYLDCGDTPPEGSQDWVAPIVQDLFDTYIIENEELRNYLKGCNWLNIK